MNQRPPKDPDRTSADASADFAMFAVTVDVILMSIRRRELRILLVQRGTPPYKGGWALPGGLVMKSEPLEEAAQRVVYEQSGIVLRRGHLEQVGAYGDPGRDPRTRVVTVAYWAVAPSSSSPCLDPESEGRGTPAYVEFVPVPEIESGRMKLAFDHARIVAGALNEVRSSLETTTLARRFCPPEFTISQLREVYEAVWGAPLDAANFQRRVLQSEGFITPLDKWSRPSGKGGRPARLWEAEGGYRRLPRPFPAPWRDEED